MNAPLKQGDTLYFEPAIRRQWPDPLAMQWLAAYPQLFDADDLRITRRQPNKHFCEWFAAIHLFHRDGIFFLVEKYMFANHPRKRAVLGKILNEEQILTLDAICEEFKIQLPDLLVYAPDHSCFSFVEVKGPGDTLRRIQKLSHTAIRDRLNVTVELITVSMAPQSSTELDTPPR